MRLICGIDIGLVNFAYCIVDSECQRIVEWKVVRLASQQDSTEYKLFKAVKLVTQEIPECAHYAIENQIPQSTHEIQHIMCGVYGGLCAKYGAMRIDIISPACAKAKYGLCTGHWKTNKEAVVKWCRTQLPDTPSFDHNLADAYLMCRYFLDTETKDGAKGILPQLPH